MIPGLVAHRGQMSSYPENSLPALEAALRAGGCWLEFDVQMTSDGELVLLHDADLRRTAGQDVSIFDLDGKAATAVSVHESARFGERFAPTLLPTLKQALDLISAHPQATAFVEIKRQSLQRWGCATVIERLLEVLEGHGSQCVVISFEAEAIEAIRSKSKLKTGWVLRNYDDHHHRQAQSIEPNWLILNHKKIPPGVDPWKGDWKWMLYDITDPSLALEWGSHGVELIETADIEAMLKDPKLATRGCEDGP